MLVIKIKDLRRSCHDKITPTGRCVCLSCVYLYISYFCNRWKEGELSVALIVRQKGSRRFDLPVELPITDSRKVFVIQDRRRLPDLCNAKYGLDDLKIILSKMSDA